MWGWRLLALALFAGAMFGVWKAANWTYATWGPVPLLIGTLLIFIGAAIYDYTEMESPDWRVLLRSYWSDAKPRPSTWPRTIKRIGIYIVCALIAVTIFEGFFGVGF